MSLLRAVLTVGGGAMLFVAFKRWQESFAVGSFPPASPAPAWLPAPLYDAVETVASTVMPMSVSAAGRAFIKQNEGFNLHPYADAGGQSIYWGHFIKPGETFSYTMDDAERVFDADIRTYEGAINSMVHVPLSQNQYDALADFVYNEGISNFARSLVLQRLNARDYAGAAADFANWTRSSGRKNPVLAQRRSAEQQMFDQSGTVA